MLGFHKQMYNRIKLLEEILSFRMKGVDCDNCYMYVYGYKSVSYVFFFSSRRRHTRFSRDWSSDVCSSDLWRSASSGPDQRYSGSTEEICTPAAARAFPNAAIWALSARGCRKNGRKSSRGE